MLAVIEFDLKTLSSWLGLVGGSIGLIGGAISLYDRWKSNRPRLRFFVTHPFVGMNVNVDRATKFFSVWLRIANLSKQSAFLYLDTILVELRKGTSWYRAPWMEVDPKEVPTTDFPLDPQIRLGLRKPAYLSTFGDNLISYDRPLCGRVVVGLPEGIKDLHEIEGVRITVEDSHRIKYCEKIDLTKEREQHDPRYQTGPKIVSDNS